MTQKFSKNDEAIIEEARKLISDNSRNRRNMLICGIIFIGFAIFLTFSAIHKLEEFKPEELKIGFIYGFALGVIWVFFGIIGAMFLGKFFNSCGADFRKHELLIMYHDRLRELGQLKDLG